MALAAAIVLLVIPWLIGPKDRSMTKARRATLIALRTAATLMLILAWLRPTLLNINSEPLPGSLLMLLDTSRSMSVEDSIDGESRWSSVRRLVGLSQEALAKLMSEQEVRAYSFDQTLTPLAIKEDGTVQLPVEPTGGQTAIGSSLDDLLTREGDQRLLAVIVLSDGAQRALPPRDLSPLVVARRLAAEETPVYALSLGERASQDRADLAIEDLVVSESTFAGTPLEAGARLRIDGYPNREVRVQLLWENDKGEPVVVDSMLVRSAPGASSYPVLLRHTPQSPGERKLSIRVEPLEGETLTDNNSISTFVTVRDGGIRVLYLAGAARVGGPPGLEQRFIRSSLAASPDLGLERKVFDYRQRRQALDEAFDQVDVVVLDNLDAEAFGRRTWQELAAMVQQGVGLAMIGGPHSFGPGGHRATALADILPVELGRAERQAFGQPIREDVHLQGPLQLMPTSLHGKRHPIMQLGSTSWSELPPLDGANRFDLARLKANALVLAESKENGRWPLIVAAQPGVGRVLAFAGDSTWRWVLEGQGEAHRRFWRQVVLWLARQEETAEDQVVIELGARRVTSGAKLEVFASLRASDESPQDDVRLEAQVTLPTGEQRELLLSGDPARSRGTFRETLESGDYLVEVKAFRDRDSEPLSLAQSRFLVPEQDLELDRPEAEPDMLERLARSTKQSGGALLAPEELPELLERLAKAPIEEKQEIVSRYTPWSTWPFFLLLVVLMTTEWWMRRRWGMP